MADWKPTWQEPTDTELDAEIEAARVRADRSREDAVLALSARYDRATRRVIVELNTGSTFIFPVDRVQGLQGATDDDLATIGVMPLGDLLEWPRLDWHCSLPALMAGHYGSKAWMERQHTTQPEQHRAADG
ncbi:MAG TPA: DUF2442 domain-containing protein [Pantanalinema sp.]